MKAEDVCKRYMEETGEISACSHSVMKTKYILWLEREIIKQSSNVVNPLLGEGPTIDQYLDLLVTLEDEGLILTDNLNLIKHKPNNKFEIIIKKWIVGLST